MTSVSKNFYIDKLDDIINKYNNTYHSPIKMKYVNVKSNTYINSSKEINNKNPKFKNDDNVGISKYRTFFTKGYPPNPSEEVSVIKKVKNTVPWTMLSMVLTGKELLEPLMKTNCKKLIKKSLEPKM